MSPSAPNLFSPLTIRSLTLKNRILVSPMCQYSCEDGFANDWHLVHLGSRAVGGAAAVITEAAAVTPEGRISPGDLGLWKDEHIEPLARITQFIRAQGVVVGIQLAHAGRKASKSAPWAGDKVVLPENGGWSPVYAPSEIPFDANSLTPKALTIDEIQTQVQAFADAAKRALKAGFQIVEIHAAHGYLLHEFLSPLSNQRTDEYGGSFENRIRFVCEVTKAVRAVWPEGLPLFVRISATDWVDGGWDLPQSVKLASVLKTMGVDLIDCSSGALVADARIPAAPGYQLPFARAVKQESKILTGAVGLITEPTQADEIIENGDADVVLLARELLRDPNWPLWAAFELGHSIDWPKQYERAKFRHHKG